MTILENIEFSIFGLILVVVMLTPNLLFMVLNKDKKERVVNNTFILTLEQIGRYGSMLFMIVTISYKEVSENMLVINIILSAILTVFYLWSWRAYFLKPSHFTRLLLAILPSIIFVMNGFLMNHIFLIVTAIIFALSHITITNKEK